MLAHIDLCSGIGGFALGFQRAGLSKPVLFCDIEPWSRQILKKHWPDVPIAEDVKELANDPGQIIKAINGRDSILSGGFPCQPFSAAGARRGFEDDRHIWPQILSIIQQVRPNWVVFENVSGLITLGLNEVLSDLADKANYSVQTFHIGAVSVDAPHRRMRLWIVGNRNDNGASTPRDLRIIQREPEWTQTDLFKSEGSSDVENANGSGWHTQSLSSSKRDSRENNNDTEQSSQRRGKGALANASNKGIRSRIRGTSSQSPEKSSGGRNHHEGSRANGGAQDSKKSQDIQEALANAQSKRDNASEAHAQTSSQSQGLRESGGSSEHNNVANASNKQLKGRSEEQIHGERDLQRESGQGSEDASGGYAPLSKLGRMVNGLSTWVDEPPGIPRTGPSVKGRAARLKGLGNAIVPQIAERIGQTIKLIQLQGTQE